MTDRTERFMFVPPTKTALWGITIQSKDGSYRTPEPEELKKLVSLRDELAKAEQREVELRDALAAALTLLRCLVTHGG